MQIFAAAVSDEIANSMWKLASTLSGVAESVAKSCAEISSSLSSIKEDGVSMKLSVLSGEAESSSGNIAENMIDISISADYAADSVADAMRKMIEAVRNATYEIGSLVSDINNAFRSIKGPTISTSGLLIGGGRASGGSVKAGVPYITGEKGAELFVPSTNGYIYNADDTSDILDRNSGTVININGDIYDDARSMRAKLRSAVIGILEEQLAYG